MAKLDTKSRTILALAAAASGGAWCTVLGFPWLVRVLVAVGATLPIWVMSRGVLHESRTNDTAAVPSPDREQLADVFPLDRMRIVRHRHDDGPDSSRLTG
ncbi:MAG: hypothetical protein ABMA25_04050 [Ilumatobacteraceae bacterium]